VAGLVVSTTKVGEFLSAMAHLHIPKKLTIPIAVMLRYLPTIREDWHYIKDAMRLRDASPTPWGFLKARASKKMCILVPAEKGGQQDGGRAVHRLCDPRHRKSEAENLPCKNSNEVSGLSDNGVFCGVSCR